MILNHNWIDILYWNVNTTLTNCCLPNVIIKLQDIEMLITIVHSFFYKHAYENLVLTENCRNTNQPYPIVITSIWLAASHDIPWYE